MNEKYLSDVLLNGETEIDVEALTAKILRRDRRRMWFLGIACIITWMAVVMLPWATIMPMVAKVVTDVCKGCELCKVVCDAAKHQAIEMLAMGADGKLLHKKGEAAGLGQAYAG